MFFEQYDSHSQQKFFFLAWLKTFDSFRSAKATSSLEFNWGKVLADAIRLQIDPIPTGLWRLTAAKSSAIIAACMLGNKSELEKLIDTYSLKNPLNLTGKTVLHAAVEGGNVEVVQFLLDQGADIQAKTKDGTLPIDLAVDAQNSPVIVALATHESHQRREKLRF
jgi:ankyrin repeat protein